MFERAAIDLFFGAFALMFLMHQLEEKSPIGSPVSRSIKIETKADSVNSKCAIGLKLIDEAGETHLNVSEQNLGLGKVDIGENRCTVRWTKSFDSDSIDEVIVFLISGYYGRFEQTATLFIDGSEKATFCLKDSPKMVKTDGTASAC